VDKLKTTNIKGNEYVEVNTRLKYFREKFAGYSLLSEIVQLDDKVAIIKAIVINDKGVMVAQGLAREINGDGMVNKTSYVENCETSAWGRALANFGIGIDNSVASADEVDQAIKQQELLKKLDESTEKLSGECEPTIKDFIDDIITAINQGKKLTADENTAYQWAIANIDNMPQEHEERIKNKLGEILKRLAG